MNRLRLLLASALLPALWAAGCHRPPAEPFAQVAWTEDYAAALHRAQNEHKFLFVNFESSDSCPPCQAMEREVFNTQPFKDFSDQNLVLVKADYPQLHQQQDAVLQQNRALMIQYNLKAFPTIIVADGAGQVLGKIEGYDYGGARNYLGKIARILAAEKTAPAAAQPPRATPQK